MFPVRLVTALNTIVLQGQDESVIDTFPESWGPNLHAPAVFFELATVRTELWVLLIDPDLAVLPEISFRDVIATRHVGDLREERDVFGAQELVSLILIDRSREEILIDPCSPSDNSVLLIWILLFLL